jgi:hypothetical protein
VPVCQGARPRWMMATRERGGCWTRRRQAAARPRVGLSRDLPAAKLLLERQQAAARAGTLHSGCGLASELVLDAHTPGSLWRVSLEQLRSSSRIGLRQLES